VTADVLGYTYSHTVLQTHHDTWCHTWSQQTKFHCDRV